MVPVRLLLFVVLSLITSASWAFSFDDVAAQAKDLSSKPWERPKAELPGELADLSYNQYKQIRFKPDKALWHNTRIPFEIQFFHLGSIYQTPVKINLVHSRGTTPLLFDPDQFDYGDLNLDKSKLTGLGYAGFRVHYPINSPDTKDEVAFFLGASFFRGLPAHAKYGVSARGLAVDTALMSGEEFPQFTEFWIVWPDPGAKSLTIYALLDSRRMTGAYQFEIKPGDTTRMPVKVRLFLREPVGKLGLAPLTSMFVAGENQRLPVESYRPEIHDSDGILVHNGDDEWIWRPLVNPHRLLVTSFAVEDPKGFGLMQRDHDFDHYQDLGARFDERPSAWVEPGEGWGKGRVELVQIPTPDETNDNIVAYFVRDVPPPPGQPFDFSYTLNWQYERQTLPEDGHVTQTRFGVEKLKNPDDSIQVVVDFNGPSLMALPQDATVFPGLWISDNGQLLERKVEKNDVTGGWRLTFRFRRIDPQKPVEMRAKLHYDNKPISETWSYLLPAA